MYCSEKTEQEFVNPEYGHAAEMVSIAPDSIQAANSTHFRPCYGLFGFFLIRAQYRAYVVRRFRFNKRQ
ncbi:MAG: hypothetical protein ABGY96_25185 [bacterium]|nr:hypothetical protein [Gammaproteobacteria bacterium]